MSVGVWRPCEVGWFGGRVLVEEEEEGWWRWRTGGKGFVGVEGKRRGRDGREVMEEKGKDIVRKELKREGKGNIKNEWGRMEIIS